MQTCKQCNAGFEVTDSDRQFYEKVSPVFAGKKILVPDPALCPECRAQRRMAWRNERTLYTRPCDLCKKDIVSLYHKDAPFTVYCKKCWWSDRWSAMEFGREFDFGRSFTEQFKELQAKVPRLTLLNSNSENSDYSNHSAGNKNCYFVFVAFDGENNYHSWGIKYNSNNNIDCYTCIHNSEFCYECSQCINCNELKFSQYCKDCSDSAFLYDCIGCHDCYRCAGLRNKEYCFENEEYSKEEYHKIISDLGSQKTLLREKELYGAFIQNIPRRYVHNTNCPDCTGDEMINCNQCFSCFDIQEAEHCKFVVVGESLKDCFDCYGVGPAELLYEVHGMLNGYQCIACHASYNNKQIFYSDICQNSQNLFGCVGIQRGNFCVFNKQYSKEEYEKLVPQLIEQMTREGLWGEFLPASLSPFAYNETTAQEYFQLTKNEALSQGYLWSDYIVLPPKVDRTITTGQMKGIPDHIGEVPDDIVNWALTCEASGKLYRIIKQELKFYKEHNLPGPRRHPDQRHKDRIALQNPRKFWERNCMKCGAEILTTYSPVRPEIVYCEPCYLKEVY